MQITAPDMKSNRITLADTLINKNLIYIDTKYWVELCDDAFSNDFEEQKL